MVEGFIDMSDDWDSHVDQVTPKSGLLPLFGCVPLGCFEQRFSGGGEREKGLYEVLDILRRDCH